MRDRHMRLAMAFVVAAVSAGALAVGAAADRSDGGGKRLRIVFEEARLSTQEGAGMRQTILNGTGTFKGFGAATEVVAVSIDLTATPCGTGSSTSTILRRIVVPEGTLVLKTPAHRCPTGGGAILATGEYVVDGTSSTGIFAGARGRGSDTVEIPPPTVGPPVATITGRLDLAGRDDEDDD